MLVVEIEQLLFKRDELKRRRYARGDLNIQMRLQWKHEVIIKAVQRVVGG
ncbi:hypothetical protein GCM10025791_18880 [Halioxenophilus aromaticivorans]|uniref:Uncharacterized protein n=1 Tax=Halioxenophilus aromaticivorans TaxID=1306992 RepID=A0AAV3U1D9_9ALTE